MEDFSDFANSHSGNVSGVKVSMSIKDCQGNWHTLSQRLFKKGSIHIIALIVVISILLVKEIGSLTKTFTAALINKAVFEGKVNTSDTIDCYLALPAGNDYPTIEELLTHTSGY